MNKISDYLFDIFLKAPYLIKWLGINMYGEILKRERFGKDFYKFYEFLKEAEYWDIRQIKKFQTERLRYIMEVAANVPYYNNVFSELKFNPSDIKSIEDIKRLPILSKEIIRKHFNLLLNQKELNYGIKHSSSGTTGQKIEFYLPKFLAYGLNTAILWRQYNWAGIKLGEKRVTIGGRIFTRTPPYYIYNMAENQLLLSIHHLNNTTVDDYIDKIKDFKPSFIQGHPSGIYFLAYRMFEKNIKIPLKGVFTTGETLGEDQRLIIEESFSTRVFESYGLGESVVAAQECEEHKGFHEISILGVIELEKCRLENQFTVIGTSIWNNIMPFIRYKIEDIVEPIENPRCSCGRGYPLIFKRIIGRIDDVVKTPDNIIVLPVTIRMTIKPYLQSFENYQFQQVSSNYYRLILVGEEDKNRESIIINKLKYVLGDKAKIEFKYGDSILTSGGKIRNVVNLYEKLKINDEINC